MPVGFSGSSYFDGHALVDTLSRNEVHSISPIGPTTMDALLRLPLPGLDHSFNSIDALMVYPGPIDVERLKRAIGMTLQAYPHAAGRLQKDVKGKWHIKLSKSSVPLTVTASTSVLREDALTLDSAHKDLVDPLPWTYFPLDNERMSREPLIRFKLVNLVMTGETTLAVHMSHLLGDESSAFMLLKTVSDYYEHPDCRPSVPFPTYEKYLSTPPPPPLPSSETYHQAAACIPMFFKPYTETEHSQLLEESRRTTDRVDLWVSGRQMRALQRVVSAEVGEKLSQGDALVSLFWKAINEVYPSEERCNRLMNVVQYRARITDDDETLFDFPSNSSVGNVRLPFVSAPVPPSDFNSLSSLALRVRSLLSQICDPQLNTPCIALAESLSLSLVTRGQIASFAPPKGCVGVSLMQNGGFHDVHFGYKGRVKYWPLNEPVEREIRVVPANGEWVSVTGVRRNVEEGNAVVVSLRVKREAKEAFVRLVKDELKRVEDAMMNDDMSYAGTLVQQML